MIQIAIVPILGLLCICGLCIYSMTRQSGLVATEHKDVAELITSVRRRERDVNQAFCDSVMNGQDVAECFAVHERERAEAFPGEIRNPTRWVEDDLESFHHAEKRRRKEKVNRKLLLPAVGGSLVIVACTIVAAGTLYYFESSRLEAPDPLQAEIAGSPPISGTDSFDWTSFDDTGDVPDAARVDGDTGTDTGQLSQADQN